MVPKSFSTFIFCALVFLSSCLDSTLSVNPGSQANSASNTNSEYASPDVEILNPVPGTGFPQIPTNPGLETPLPVPVSPPPTPTPQQPTPTSNGEVAVINSSTTQITLKSGIQITFDKPVKFGRYSIGRVDGDGPEFVQLISPATLITQITHLDTTIPHIRAAWGANQELITSWQQYFAIFNPASPISIPNQNYPMGLFLAWADTLNDAYPVWGSSSTYGPVETILTVLPATHPWPKIETLAPPVAGSPAVRNFEYLTSDIDYYLSGITAAQNSMPSGVGSLNTIVDRICTHRWNNTGHKSPSGVETTTFGLRFFGQVGFNSPFGATPYRTGYNRQAYGGFRDPVFFYYLMSLVNPLENIELRKKAWRCAFQNVLLPMMALTDFGSNINTAESGGHGASYYMATSLSKYVFQRHSELRSRLSTTLQDGSTRLGQTNNLYRSALVGNRVIFGRDNSNSDFFTFVNNNNLINNPSNSNWTRAYDRPFAVNSCFFDTGSVGGYREQITSYTSHSGVLLGLLPAVLAETPSGSTILEYTVRIFLEGMYSPPDSSPLWNNAISDAMAVGITNSNANDLINFIRSWRGTFNQTQYQSVFSCRALAQAYPSAGRNCSTGFQGAPNTNTLTGY
jgi:hypothetical protein